MTRYVALLRAVNVGGTGKLPMTELKSMCSAAGFARVETYIASGNVVFDGKARPSRVKAALEACLLEYFGKPMGVMVRTAAEMATILKANPFPEADPKLTYAIFLDKPLPRNALDHVVGQSTEKIRLGEREIFVHYPDGMGRSKLRIPAAAPGTARNMNTVAKLTEIAAKP
jgi:uncharacterized protein (DUF1697 family)